jgi:hypothetical protein
MISVLRYTIHHYSVLRLPCLLSGIDILAYRYIMILTYRYGFLHFTTCIVRYPDSFILNHISVLQNQISTFLSYSFYLSAVDTKLDLLISNSVPNIPKLALDLLLPGHTRSIFSSPKSTLCMYHCQLTVYQYLFPPNTPLYTDMVNHAVSFGLYIMLSYKCMVSVEVVVLLFFGIRVEAVLVWAAGRFRSSPGPPLLLLGDAIAWASGTPCTVVVLDDGYEKMGKYLFHFCMLPISLVSS